MSREGAKRGHDPYVKHVQVRPCDPGRVGTTRVNIAGFDFELIEPVRAASADAPSQAREAPPGRHNNPAPARDAVRPVVHPEAQDDGRGNGHGNGNGYGNGGARVGGDERALARPDRRMEVVREEPTFDDGTRTPAADEGGGFDFAGIHRLLRGKYIAAVVLSLIFAGAGVFAGIKLGHPSYQSTGLINIISSTVIYDTPEKRNTSFQDMMHAEAAMITSQRTIEMAMGTDAWRKRSPWRDDETEEEFIKNLQVTQEGQLLIVHFTDRDPVHAKAAVDGVITAFQMRFDGEQEERRKAALETLQTLRKNLAEEVRGIRAKIESNAQELGPAGLRAERDFLAVELRRKKMQLDELNAEDPVTAAAENSAPADRYLQQLEDRQFDYRSRLAQLKATGAGVHLRQYEETVSMLKSIEDQMKERKKEVTAQAVVPAPGAPAATQPQSVLDQRKQRLEAQRDDYDKQLRKATASIAVIDGLLIEEARTQHDLDTAEEALRQRTLEEKVFEATAAKTLGDTPLTPSRDTRINYSVVGGLGGIALGVGLMALLGLTDRRVLEPGDTKGAGSAYPVLGILPELPDDLADPEQTAVAAQAVHEIRNRLQLAAGGRMHQVFAVTGSVAGCGKTSLTLGLGVSFATGGFRTLVVDADLVGGGLSSRVTTLARRKIGQVLLKEGLVTPLQLDEALSRGRTAGRRVGEMLVQLGHLAEADLLAAIERQAKYPIGILDAIAGEELSECTVATGIDNLWAITLGGATPADAGVISGAALQRFIDRARQRFDIIILDSGPVPGSIEASIAAAHADAVVLVVSRGDTRPYVERSIKYLRELPVRFGGLVFNRARKRDIDRYGSSRVSGDGSVSPQRMVPVALPENLRFGPLPRCVVSRSVRPAEPSGNN